MMRSANTSKHAHNPRVVSRLGRSLFLIAAACLSCATPEGAVADDGPSSGSWAARKIERKADTSATWGRMFNTQVGRCWKKPDGTGQPKSVRAAFAIRLKPDGSLEGAPIPTDAAPTTSYEKAYQLSALRALMACGPYQLPAASFDEWKYFVPVFAENP